MSIETTKTERSAELAIVHRGVPERRPEMKRCPDCDRDYPATFEYFHRRSGRKLNTYCKACASARARAHYAANREHHLALAAAWRKEHGEELSAYFHEYRLMHSEEKREAGRKYHAAQRAAILPKKQAYYQSHKAQHAEQAIRWRAENPDKVKAHATAKNHRRRGVAPDAQARAYMRTILRDPCPYCGLPCEVIDHIVPVSAGGSGDWSNLTGACRSCNASKSNKSLLRFLIGRAS